MVECKQIGLHSELALRVGWKVGIQESYFISLKFFFHIYKMELILLGTPSCANNLNIEVLYQCKTWHLLRTNPVPTAFHVLSPLIFPLPHQEHMIPVLQGSLCPCSWHSSVNKSFFSLPSPTCWLLDFVCEGPAGAEMLDIMKHWSLPRVPVMYARSHDYLWGPSPLAEKAEDLKSLICPIGS